MLDGLFYLNLRRHLRFSCVNELCAHKLHEEAMLSVDTAIPKKFMLICVNLLKLHQSPEKHVKTASNIYFSGPH
jgi:hypothetical protein